MFDLMSRVDVQGPADCWPWLGYVRPASRGLRHGGGYGQVSIDRRLKQAHRVVYEHLIGPVPDELDVDHLCRNRACCNPAHLEPVTRQVNVLRGEGLAALNARKTHCVNGHEFTPENTRLADGRSGRKTRVCRACTRENQRRSKARKKVGAC